MFRLLHKPSWKNRDRPSTDPMQGELKRRDKSITYTEELRLRCFSSKLRKQGLCSQRQLAPKRPKNAPPPEPPTSPHCPNPPSYSHPSQPQPSPPKFTLTPPNTAISEVDAECRGPWVSAGFWDECGEKNKWLINW
ncbi:hypothetical protein M758_6G078600 [Ceratodon purpureus]|nr:hypothetical protein M758_6G078600 [Ceratodon purpureus]